MPTNNDFLSDIADEPRKSGKTNNQLLEIIAESGGGSGSGVSSVNGQTGVVVLDAEDVGAATESYVNSRTPTIPQNTFPFRISGTGTGVPNGNVTLASGAATPNTVSARNATGNVFVAIPTDPLHAATKSYVDDKVISGTGFPNGVVSAPVGTVYIDKNATNNAVQWAKVSGTGNTGWDVVYGNTGWRSLVRWDASGNVIDGTIPTGFEPVVGRPGGIYLSRIGRNVYLSTVDVAVTTANPEITGTPAGFRGNSVQPYPALPYVKINGSTLSMGIMEVGASIYRFRGAVAGDRLGTIGGGGYGAITTWTTSENWPVALPGTAV